MMRFKVFYMKDDAFKTFIFGNVKPEVSRLDKTHTFVCELEVRDTEAAYTHMQGENWSANGEAQELLRSLGLGHTSMCVGDVLQNSETGEYFSCANIGFIKLGVM